MHFLFHAGTTLYSRSGFSVAAELVRRGHQVTYVKRSNFTVDLRKYIDQKNKNTLQVTFQDERALTFLNRISGNEFINTGWDILEKSCNFTWAHKKLDLKNFDAYVLVKKMPSFLNHLDAFNFEKMPRKKKLIVLPYEQYPYLSLVNLSALNEVREMVNRKGVSYFDINQGHYPRHVIMKNNSFILVGWPWFDSLYNLSQEYKRKNNFFIYLHPGGRRNVLTTMKDDILTCIKKQTDFFNSMYENCSVLRKKKFIVATHPLAPKGHRESDIYKIMRNTGWTNFEIISGCTYVDTLQSKFCIFHGGSSIYDLHSARVPFYVLGFPGDDRYKNVMTDKGRRGKEKLVNPVGSFSELNTLIKQRKFKYAELERKVSGTCRKLFTGNVCSTIGDYIEEFVYQ